MILRKVPGHALLATPPAAAAIVLAACSTSPGELQETYPPPTPDFASLATALPPSPIDFITEVGQFSITFPCCVLARGALAQYSSAETLFDQAVVCHVTVLPEDGASWQVEHCDIPPALASARTVRELLDWARDDLLEDSRAHLEQETSISADFEVPAVGRSLAGLANMRGILLDGTFRARLYLLGQRLYRVSARVYNENWGNRLAMIDGYLDSFFVHSALTIPFEATPTSGESGQWSAGGLPDSRQPLP